MNQPVKLLTRADDAGLTVGTNRAILAACAAGGVRNVGILAVGPAVEHAAELFRDSEGIALGLHFTLTCEWDTPLWAPLASVSRVPTLLDARGALPRTTALLKSQEVFGPHVVEEARAQLSRLRSLGLRITYLDDHMACGWLPGMKQLLHRFATEEGLIFGPSEFSPLPFGLSGRSDPDPRGKLAGVVPGSLYLHVTHPAEDDAEFRSFSATGMDVDRAIRCRAKEASLWTSVDFVQDLERRGAELCRYDEVFKVGDRLICPNW